MCEGLAALELTVKNLACWHGIKAKGFVVRDANMGQPVRGWQPQLVSQIGVPDHAGQASAVQPRREVEELRFLGRNATKEMTCRWIRQGCIISSVPRHVNTGKTRPRLQLQP